MRTKKLEYKDLKKHKTDIKIIYFEPNYEKKKSSKASNFLYFGLLYFMIVVVSIFVLKTDYFAILRILN